MKCHKIHRKIKVSQFILLLYLIFPLSPLFSQEKEKTKEYELENGLKVFLYEKHTLPLINLVIAVNLGSKNETEETSGLVHILEHYSLFRGTEFRTGAEISQDTRRHGAYFNARTGNDLATFELSLPSEHIDFALKNQKEILFNLKITQDELDEEKQVILEELNQLHDDPIRYSTSLVYQSLFQNHSYQWPVQGSSEVIEAVTVEQMEKFYKKYFIPSNCALAAVGDFDIKEMEEKIKKMFGDLENKDFIPQKFEKASPLEKTVEIEKEMDVNMGYLVIGMLAPDYNQADQYAVDVLTEILGRGINPMLNNHLGSKRILVSSLRMGYSSLKYGGAVVVQIVLDPKKIKAAKREVIRFLKEARRLNYSKKDFFGENQFYALDFLESAKNQIKFKVHQSQEKGLLMATSLARYMLLNENPDRGSYLESIEKINSSSLREAAGKYLGKGRYVIVTIVPQKKKK